MGAKIDAERARLSFLADASAVLASSLDYEITLRQVADLVVSRLADWCSVHIVRDDGSGEDLVVAHVDPTKVAWAQEIRRRYPPDPDATTGVTNVLRTGNAELYPDISDDLLVAVARDTEHLALLRAAGMASAMIVPMIARGRTVGAIAMVAAESGRRFGRDDLELAEILARRCAQAVDNARLYRQAQAAEARSRFLAEASAVLAGSLDYGEAVERVVRLAVPSMADWCVIDLLGDDGALHRLAIVHSDPGRTEAADELRRRYPLIPAETTHTAWKALRSGRSWFDPDVSPVRLAAQARDADHLALLRRLGFASELVVPLVARGRAVGVLTLVFGDSGRRHAADDVAMGEELARHCALAIDNARLYADAQAAESRYRALFDGGAVGVVLVGDDGRSLDVNAAASAMLGFTRDELRSLRLDDGSLLAGEDAETVAAEAFARLRRDGAWRGEIELRRNDGTALPAEAEAVALDLPEGRVFLFQWLDATDRRERERLREEVFAAVSHDLRNPLGAVRVTTQLMMRRLRRGTLQDPEQVAEGLARIDAATSRMIVLIDDIVDAARVRAGEALPLEPEPIDLVELARRSVEQYQATTQDHQLHLMAEAETLVGDWDPRRLERVLANLLTNAIKYSPGGGEIAVELARQESDSGAWAVLSVSDRGVGIPAGDLPHVFDRFRRGGNVGGIGGTGLGLAGVRQIVAQHGGTVTVESKEGRGSTFTVRLALPPASVE